MRVWVVDLYDGDCDYPFHHIIFFFRRSAERYVENPVNKKFFKENHIRIAWGGEHVFFKFWKAKE